MEIRGRIVVLFASLSACSPPDSPPRSGPEEERLATIERKIRDGEVQLTLVQRTLEAEQRKLEDARAEVVFQQCRMKEAEIRAEIDRRRSECAREIAVHNLCMANQSKNEAEAGIGGCLVGIAAAAISGGAATPWALGGCTAGLAVGGALAEACPEPACVASLNALPAKVLSERSMTSLPRCGGWLGAEVVAAEVAAMGLRVKRAQAGSYASLIGIVPGDVIVEVQGHRTPSLEDLRASLETIPLGALLKTTVVRGDRRLDLSGRAASLDATGKHIKKAVLGVHMETEPAAVRLQHGALIASVDARGPAAQTLPRGEQIVAVHLPARQEQPARRLAITQPGDLDMALNDVRAGEEISLVVIQSGFSRSVPVRLRQREGQTGL